MKRLTINTLKMLSAKNANANANTNDNIKQNEILNNTIIESNNKLQYLSDIDYNFCSIYYETKSNDLINKFIEQTGIKNMINLNNKLDQNFNWKNYAKFCPQLNNNEILVKKHFLEKLNEKSCNKQLLNIIIIKTSNTSIDTIFSNFDNINIQFSLITNKKDDVEHYNVKNFIYNNINDQLNILNRIIKENVSEYFMIIYDYYIFENNFISKIIKDLNKLINTNSLLLVQNTLKTDTDTNTKTEYFRIKTDFFKKITEPYICIINNDIKQEYDYSISEIGIVLYINQVINKYNSILVSNDYSFKNNNDDNNKLVIKDMILLFDLYISNIENDIINEYDLNN